MDPLTPVKITALADGMREVVQMPDPLKQAQRAGDLLASLQGMGAEALADLRRDALARAVATSTAATVAEQLGISRARVYALVDGRGAVGITRRRRGPGTCD